MASAQVDRQATEYLAIPDDEFANVITHGIGAALAIVGLIAMVLSVAHSSVGVIACCVLYALTVVAVFVFSTLSHVFTDQRWRHAMRAWDQGVIYLMIAGTYTPFTWAFAGSYRLPLLAFMWGFAAIGLWSKVMSRHRVEAIATSTYLLLGWLPAIILGPLVPRACLLAMGVGGAVYSIGVIFLMLDQRVRYFHAVWHILVMLAASIHYLAIITYVIVNTAA